MLIASGKSFEDIHTFFARNHIKLKRQWLEDLLKYLITYRKNTKELINMVFYQWLYTEIGQSTEASINTDIQEQQKNPQIFQIHSVADIGTPKLKQFKKMTDPGYDESTAELGINDFIGNNFNPNKCTKCYCLQLTDCQGKQFKAFEKKRVPQLSLSTCPGSKILVFSGTKILQGVLFLTPENCQFLGGAVERLLLDKNILKQLAEQLGKPFVGGNIPGPELTVANNKNDLSKPQQPKMMHPVIQQQQLKMPPPMPPTTIQLNQQPKMLPTAIQQHQQTKMPTQAVHFKTTQLKNLQPPISIFQQPEIVPPTIEQQQPMKPISKIPILMPLNSNTAQNQQSKIAFVPPSDLIQQQGTSLLLPKSISSIIQQPKVVTKLPLTNSSNIQPEIENQSRKRANIDAKVVEAYKSLGVHSLAEVYNKMNYSIGCKRFAVIAIVQEITAPFRIVDDKWSMSVALIDESQRRLECTLEHELLLNLVMMTPKEAQEIKSHGNAEKKKEGVERLQLMQEQLMRLDLIFEVEVMFRGKMPIIKSVKTLAERLEYV